MMRGGGSFLPPVSSGKGVLQMIYVTSDLHGYPLQKFQAMQKRHILSLEVPSLYRGSSR